MSNPRLSAFQERILYVWHCELTERGGVRHPEELVVFGAPNSCECHYRNDEKYESEGRWWVLRVLSDMWWLSTEDA